MRVDSLLNRRYLLVSGSVRVRVRARARVSARVTVIGIGFRRNHSWSSILRLGVTIASALKQLKWVHIWRSYLKNKKYFRL